MVVVVIIVNLIIIFGWKLCGWVFKYFKCFCIIVGRVVVILLIILG